MPDSQTLTPSPPPDPQTTRAHVLLVDDNTELLQAMRKIIESSGFTVTTCSCAKSARSEFSRPHKPFSILLTDLDMPGEDGLTLLKDLVQRQDTLVGILFTGFVETDIAVRAMRAGAIDFLPKPISQQDLIIALNRAQAFHDSKVIAREKEKLIIQMSEEREQELDKTKKHLENSYEFMLESLVALMEAKKKDTGAHTKRVARISNILGQALNLSAERLDTLRRAAILHDIGKVGIPDAILNKTAPFTESEWKTMQSHVDIGHHILRQNPYLEDVAEIVLCHHEHFDGSGYPRNLRGAEIPLEARIFHLADAYDGIRSQRAYHERHTAEETFQILEKEKETFDPRVFQSLRECLPEIQKIYHIPSAT